MANESKIFAAFFEKIQDVAAETARVATSERKVRNLSSLTGSIWRCNQTSDTSRTPLPKGKPE